MKKIFFVFCFSFFILAGCAQKPMMDEVDKNGFYSYHNDFLNFDLLLPKEFQNYQTQRIDNENYTEVDIVVPTTDANFLQAVTGYVKPIVIRAYDKKYFAGLSEADMVGFVKAGEKGGKVFVMKFWDKTPADWKEKWTEAMKQQLLKNFKLK